MKYLIVGLGNIGAEYARTRHNIGFEVVDSLANQFNCSFSQDRHAFLTEFKHKGRTFHLIKPTTYMNLSGKAVRYWTTQLKISLDNTLVITDDIALPFGKIRIRKKGSHGGHNGLKDIIDCMGTDTFPRLRFGVDDDFYTGQQVAYVLSPWTSKEMETLPIDIDKAAEAVLSFGTIGIERTMNQYN